jgi:hypothetical protein
MIYLMKVGCAFDTHQPTISSSLLLAVPFLVVECGVQSIMFRPGPLRFLFPCHSRSDL